MTEQERRTASEAADRMSRVVASKPELAVSRSVEEFRSGGWEVTAENMEEEFGEVERRTFLDGIHWGRVIAFLAFSVSFAAYVSSRGISGGADSVFSWTTRVLDHDLSDFMSRENGWVSECVPRCVRGSVYCTVVCAGLCRVCGSEAIWSGLGQSRCLCETESVFRVQTVCERAVPATGLVCLSVCMHGLWQV
jgi:hypothetical protein